MDSFPLTSYTPSVTKHWDNPFWFDIWCRCFFGSSPFYSCFPISWIPIPGKYSDSKVVTFLAPTDFQHFFHVVFHVDFHFLAIFSLNLSIFKPLKPHFIFYLDLKVILLSWYGNISAKCCSTNAPTTSSSHNITNLYQYSFSATWLCHPLLRPSVVTKTSNL
jgi:hypothetical protein